MVHWQIPALRVAQIFAENVFSPHIVPQFKQRFSPVIVRWRRPLLKPEIGDENALEIERRKPDMLLIGYPYNMDGSASQKMKEVDAFIEILKSRFSLPVDTSDERLSSFQAEADLDAFAPKKSRKKTIAARQKYRRSGDIDSRAIAIVLQDYIDNRPA